MTKWQLFSALVNCDEIHTIRGRYQILIGKVVGIELESGDGHSFNVTAITKENHKVTVFVRTID